MKKKEYREYSPLERSKYYWKLAEDTWGDNKKMRDYYSYSQDLEDFATASGYGHEFNDDQCMFLMFDYPSLGRDTDSYLKYVKRRWIIRKADRSGDINVKNGKINIKNYKKHEKEYDQFLRRSGYTNFKK